MARSGKRVRVAESIYRDGNGHGIVVKGVEYRFGLDVERRNLIDTRDELRAKAAFVTNVKLQGTLTLAGQAQKYLDTLPPDVLVGANKTRTRSGKVILLNHWTATELGALRLDEITPTMVRDQLRAWSRSGVAPATCANRRDALSSVYTHVNGKSGYNPVRDTENPRPVYSDVRGFDMDFLQSLIDTMPDRGRPVKGEKRSTVNTAKLRLDVMLNTAIPPATLKRIQPSQVNLAAKEVTLMKRKKGKGAAGRTLPLTDQGVKALKAFVKHNLFGAFDQHGVHAAFMRRVETARTEWAEKNKMSLKPFPLPEDFKTYDIRHSFLTDFFRRTQNLDLTGLYAGHERGSKLTLRYALGGVSEVLRAAVATVNAAR